MKTFYTFKQLVVRIAEADTTDLDTCNELCAEVDSSFDRDKITWNDHEVLYKLIGKVWRED